MIFVYPAVFTPKRDGTGYEASFPDLEMCTAEGRTPEDAADAARAAAGDWISLELEEGFNLPMASDPADLEVPEGGMVKRIMVHIRLVPDYD